MIPPVAHVVWVGPQPMPALQQVLLTHNRRVLAEQGIELCLWGNAEVADLLAGDPALVRFAAAATAAGRWAFLSDCVKMQLLVRDGGWVLDADNEVVGDVRPYAKSGWISGFEHWGGAFHPITAAMASTPGHPFSRHLARIYATNRPEWLLATPNTRWISQLLFANGMNGNDQYQYVEALDVTIHPSAVFCGVPPTPETVIRHHFAGSWLPKEEPAVCV